MDPGYSLDRLALVSKLMMDERVLALRRENEGLKLDNFWLKHNVAALNRAMGYFNDDCSGRNECYCEDCIRWRLDWSDTNWVEDRIEVIRATTHPPASCCQFNKRFNYLIVKHELSTMHVKDRYQELHGRHLERQIYDCDCHIILDSQSQCVGFGRKVYRCSNTADPELVKLESLFLNLYHADDDSGNDETGL